MGSHRGRRRRKASADALKGRLRAHDPFELIRWLAFSQPDPRKALAELVQNSLDARARTIRVTRVRERGAPCLRIWDDGEGVIPDMERVEALRYIATHIGHSRKRDLSPQERLALLTQGQYGIGLLGFWSLGERLEMRTSVPEQRPHRLVLYRDRPDYTIEPLRGRLPLGDRWTEIVVVGLHREALSALIGRRAADYLASELRGQLLAREVDLSVHDRMARGRAPKLVPVRPPRFLGERIEGLGPVEVTGHAGVRFELYLGDESSDDGHPRGVSVYSSGTLVAASFHDLAGLGLDHPPWTDPRLTGLVDFPGFRVAPGSRRGVVVDEAAGAFVRALAGVESVLLGLLEAHEQRRAEELDRGIIRDLQRAFRDFYRQRPRYSLLPVRDERRDAGAGPATAGEGAAVAPGDSVHQAQEATPEAAPSPAPATPPPDLLPPGPLAQVRLSPASLRLQCGSARRVRAAALDATGRPVEDPVVFSWSLSGPVGTLDGAERGEAEVVFVASAETAEGVLVVTARSGGHEARAEADVEVLEELGTGRPDEGIPEPELVHAAGAAWRSRMEDGRWQVNTAHREYRAVADRPALKLRYLAMLFSKEVVLRSNADPRLDRPLEQLVEVAAFADRNLSRRGRRRGRKKGSREP
jgi:hypothetical protein